MVDSLVTVSIPEKKNAGAEVAKGALYGAIAVPVVSRLIDATGWTKTPVWKLPTLMQKVQMVASEAAIGAVINGLWSGISAWRHNRKVDKSYVDIVSAEKTTQALEAPQK